MSTETSTEQHRITIHRSGQRPWRFIGVEIAHQTGDCRDVTIYRRPGSCGYILSVVHTGGDEDVHYTSICDTEDELAVHIEGLPVPVADALFSKLGLVIDLDFNP